MRVECYVSDIYCDGDDCPRWDLKPLQSTGTNKREAHKEARERGWRIGKRDLCPKCQRKRGTP